VDKQAFDAAMLYAAVELQKLAATLPPSTSAIQMSPYAALRRGARSVGNAVGQFSQAPANYLRQAGQNIGNAFNRFAGQQSPGAAAAFRPLPQVSTSRNSPWLANPSFRPGPQRMPVIHGQPQNSPYQRNAQYRGSGLQTADLRARTQSEDMYLRNPNYRPGAANTPLPYAPGQTRQQAMDQLLRRY